MAIITGEIATGPGIGTSSSVIIKQIYIVNVSRRRLVGHRPRVGRPCPALSLQKLFTHLLTSSNHTSHAYDIS